MLAGAKKKGRLSASKASSAFPSNPVFVVDTEAEDVYALPLPSRSPPSKQRAKERRSRPGQPRVTPELTDGRSQSQGHGDSSVALVSTHAHHQPPPRRDRPQQELTDMLRVVLGAGQRPSDLDAAPPSAPEGLAGVEEGVEEGGNQSSDEVGGPSCPKDSANLPASMRTFQLRTGDDAINFFAQYGAASPIKFVHLLRAETGKAFRPYELVVVNPRDIGNGSGSGGNGTSNNSGGSGGGNSGGGVSHSNGGEYYTMSAAGLVRMCQGEPSEFTPLSDWMRQATLFTMLRSLRFYRLYLPAKCFRQWRDNVRFRLYCSQRRRLSQRLFLAKPTFAGPLLELRRHIADMAEVKMLDLGAIKTFEKAQFVEHQTGRRQEAARTLEACVERVSAVVHRACQDVAALPLAAAAREPAPPEAEAALLGADPEKGKSLVALKEAATARRRLLQRAALEAGMLGSFVRLADHLAVEALAALATQTLKDLLTELMRPRKAGLFETTVLFTDEGTAFTPTAAEIQEMLAALAQAVVATAAGVSRILFLRQFHAHLGPYAPGAATTAHGAGVGTAGGGVSAAIAGAAGAAGWFVGPGGMLVPGVTPGGTAAPTGGSVANRTSTRQQSAAGSAAGSAASAVAAVNAAAAAAAAGSTSPVGAGAGVAATGAMGGSGAATATGSIGAAMAGGIAAPAAAAATSSTPGPQLQAMIRGGHDFQKACADIAAKVAADFDEAAEYVVTLESVRPIYEYNRSWDFEGYARQQHSVGSLKEQLERIQGWVGELEKMRARQPCGTLEVESRKLKQTLLPMTEEKMEAIKALVRDLARAKCRDQLGKYRQRLGQLAQRPTGLRDFAAHVATLDKLRAQDKAIARNAQVVEEMYALLAAFGVRATAEDMVQVDDMHSAQGENAEAAEAARIERERRMPEMVRELDANIARLNDQLAQVSVQLDEGVFVDAGLFGRPAAVLTELEKMRHKIEQIEAMAKQYSGYQELFGITVYGYKTLTKTQEHFSAVDQLWQAVARWNDKLDRWMTDPFPQLDAEVVGVEVQAFVKDSFAAHKRLSTDVSGRLKEATQDFKLKMPVVLELGNRAMRPRHWEKLFRALGQTFHLNANFSLSELLDWGVVGQGELISELSGAASGEAQLEGSLDAIRTAWDATQLVLLPYRDQPSMWVLGGMDEVMAQLEDHQVALQTMGGSRFISGVREEVESWSKRLSLLAETLDEWSQCQRNWMYLEPIFAADDIARQLPAEAQQFQRVDKAWRTCMAEAQDDPRALSCVASGRDWLGDFRAANAELDTVQRSLEDYLETKRMAFPRFYFLSNDELLEILSQAADVRAVEQHMPKCFDAVRRMRFGEGRTASDIHGLFDAGGEYVAFTRGPVRAEGPVECWLKEVELAMRDGLYDRARDAWRSYPKDEAGAIHRQDWLWSCPAQVALVVSQIYWTGGLGSAILRVEDSRSPAPLDAFLGFGLRQLDATVALVRSDLDRCQRTLVGALITLDVHARDVVRAAVAKRVASLADFEWTRQLRYYWDAGVDDIVCRQTNTQFRYGYEYLGNGPRLVITPLTDVCYMTLTGALHMRRGGAPAGPAGTGKTETTKDLAKALAVYCVVFNCSDGLDCKIMGRFFSGLAQQGAWACFDEFNRIDVEVLSVIAQQVLCIQQAITCDLTEFRFNGALIPLNPAFGVFITMNPGYAGRTELPDNLKALFRPVAMMVPDYRMIAEIVLFSEGFANALPLSSKMAQLYALASEQLSKQDHYDFGMRAVKSVLVAAGQLKRKEPATPEDQLLIRAMRDSNVPKLLEQDLPLFHGIVGDLFPGVAVPYCDYGRLQEAVEAVLVEAGLQRVPALVAKVIQVHETQLVRHGMMMVGESGSGKTTAATTLAAALAKLHAAGVRDRDDFYRPVRRFVLNPKAITAGQLYGEFDALSGAWADGLVPKLVRQCVHAVDKSLAEGGSGGSGSNAGDGNDNGGGSGPKEAAGEGGGGGGSGGGDGRGPAGAAPLDERFWVMFDGPVDAVWIENMNTVLDDNKTLCLANSERIKLPASLHMMFEVQDLKVASPATVSRCGMVYMEQVHVGALSLVRSWGARVLPSLVPDAVSWELLELIERYLEPGLALARRCTQVVPVSDICLARGLLNLLESVLRPANLTGAAETTAKSSGVAAASSSGDVSAGAGAASAAGAAGAALGPDSRPSLSPLLRQLFAWAFMWGVCGNVHESARPQVEDFAREHFKTLVSNASAFLRDPYGVCIDVSHGELVPWSSMLGPAFSFDPRAPYSSLLVPTADTVRTSFLLERLAGAGHHALFLGETGFGKSVIVQRSLDRMAAPGERFVTCTLNCSAQTQPENLQHVFESKLEKKRKALLGPPAGKSMLLFVDDLNMPALDTYGAQPPNELLRQVIDSGGYYDSVKLFFKAVAGVVVTAAAAPPGGGRNPVSARLVRHFSVFWLTALRPESLRGIFLPILSGFLESAASGLVPLAAPLVEASVSIYVRIASELLPTPARSHYTFNLRDLSKVFQGVLMGNVGAVAAAAAAGTAAATGGVDAAAAAVATGAASAEDALLRLWCHEECRVFGDRLINDGDRDWLGAALQAELKKRLGREWEAKAVFGSLFGDYMPAAGGAAGSGGSTAADGNGGAARPYCEIESETAVVTQLTSCLEDYNLTFPSPMALVFFSDAVAHISRICRVLRQPRGNALLVGVGGSGRRSLTRLASFMAGLPCMGIEITRGYGRQEFRDDLKLILAAVGVENRPTVFLLSDTQVVEDSFLEDVNNILNSGEVPSLYAPDEAERIVAALRPLAAAAGRPQTRDAVLQYHAQLVRENLHVVLCMSPVGAGFRRRCRMFPSLVNCCTIDWFRPWPEDALRGVARSVLRQHAASLGIKASLESICEVAVALHRTASEQTERYRAELGRHNYTTPTSYLELLALYVDLLGRQRAAVAIDERRYRGGLQKLEEAKLIVNQLQASLTEMQPQLVEAQADAGQLITKVTRDQTAADKQQAVVQRDVEAADAVAASVQSMKDDCQVDLDEAMPAYHAAIRALDSLDKKSIQELKSFANPPQMVGYTLEAVCVLMGAKPRWDEAKKLMARMTFMDELKDFDKDNISAKVIKQLKPYIDNPQFVPDEVAKVSSAAKSLCMWVQAMHTYDRVAKTLGPKKAAMAAAEGQLAAVTVELKAKRDALNAVLAAVAALRETLAATERRRAELEATAARTADQLRRAEQLMDGLGDERERWEASADRLALSLRDLVGNALLASGTLSYLGPFTGPFRTDLSGRWVALCRKAGLPVAESFGLEAALADPVTVRMWRLDGLPADDFSTENGLLATLGRRWPLMIDPQGQANRWVRNMYSKAAPASSVASSSGGGGGSSGAAGSASLQVIKLTEKDFLRTLENSIRYGMPVLLENVREELEPALEPVLLKQVFRRGGQSLLRLGDTDVPYSDQFRLFMTTKLPNPHFMPEVCVKVTVINFTVTLPGLEEQLLADVVTAERPDLEVRRDELVVSIAADQRVLKDIEARILNMLAAASGNILDDEQLINALSHSKATSRAIGERLREAEATTAEISEARERYRVVATRGSLIYFVVASLAEADPMYQYSLAFYKALFVQRLRRSARSDILAERLRILVDDVTLFTYCNVCRGLFERDKLLYAFMIAASVERHARRVSEAEWRALVIGVPAIAAAAGGLAGTAGTESSGGAAASVPPPALAWLGGRGWQQMTALEAGLPELAGIVADMEAAPAAWETFLLGREATLASGGGTAAATRIPATEIAAAAGTATIPGGGNEPVAPGRWMGRLTDFQALLLRRAAREEGTVAAARHFVRQRLGPAFAEPPPFDLAAAFANSTAETPLIFVLSAGADVTDYLLELAASKGKTPSNGGLRIVSLGQGQGPVAERLMEEARVSGDWVCLQNCHLAVSWLPRLDQLLERYSSGGGGGDGSGGRKGSEPAGGVGFAAAAAAAAHPDFRLWLTTSPSPHFPVPILQNGIKITNEPPKGLRANLTRTLQDLGDAEYRRCTRPEVFQPLVYALAFFNALVLERRKFGAVGWNIPYEWMGSDLKAAVTQVRMYVEEQKAVPWDTLNVIVAEVTYGGRVTDVWDKRTIASIMRRYFDPKLLKGAFNFSDGGSSVEGSNPCSSVGGGDGSSEYGLPQLGATLAGVLEHVQNLPSEDRPETFSLHPNADITFQQKEARSLLATAFRLGGGAGAGGGGSGGGGSGGDDASVAAAAAAIAARIPAPFNVRLAQPDSHASGGNAGGGNAGGGSGGSGGGGAGGGSSGRASSGSTNGGGGAGAGAAGSASMSVFLGQELARFNALADIMRRTLAELQRAVQGLVVMSAALEDMYACFLSQRVPEAWERAGYPCLKALPAWTEDFFARLDFMGQWLQHGPRPSYWLSGFFFPQGFMTAVKQMHARTHRLAIDTLTVGCRVAGFGAETAVAAGAPAEGVYIHGLFMEGARFDRRSMLMAESRPRSLFDEMPCIWLRPEPAAASEAGSDGGPDGLYQCPLYKTSLRAGTLSTTGHSTNFVAALALPSDKAADHWVRRGCAMLCMLDD